jgi:hypothetical protein
MDEAPHATGKYDYAFHIGFNVAAFTLECTGACAVAIFSL